MSAVEELFDRLFAFESRKHKAPYPIHKKLKLGDRMELTDWLLKHGTFIDGDAVLDAGCGTGHTLFSIASAVNIYGLGISLSQKEVAFAKSSSPFSNKHLKFRKQSYDESFAEKFDKIIAIESLKHSLNLRHTLKNLLRSLKSGGQLIIVDDFLINESKRSKQHKALWEAGSFITPVQLLTEIEQSGASMTAQTDLTPFVPVRSGYLLMILIGMVRLLINLIGKKHRRNLSTYLGALLLEQMYRRGEVKYQVVVVVPSFISSGSDS